MYLNPRQQEAVSSPGVQIIVAGPGSGKTRVITEKILHLVRDEGVAPTEILALTFSEKAAREMEERLRLQTDISELTVSTFHSFCHSVLEENVLETGIDFSGGLIGRPSQLVWGLRHIDDFSFSHIELGNNAAAVIEAVIDGISAFRDELVDPESLEAYLAEKNESRGPEEDEAIELGRLTDLLTVYRAYEAYKRENRFIDFDDMIHETYRLFNEKPHVLRRYRDRFRHILVDEFQDTNVAQFALLRQLAGEHLCVVGDDDQSIYRFRGAYFGNFHDFRQTFPHRQETLLEENYRNSGTILALALELMEHAPNRESKPLRTSHPAGSPVTVARCENEVSEAEFVRSEIQRLAGSPRRNGEPMGYGDIAVLCRKRVDGLKFYQALCQSGIPCEFVGEIEFFRMPVIRDVLAYLSAIHDPGRSGIPLNRIMRMAGVPEQEMAAVNRAAAQSSYDTDDDGDGVFAAMSAAAVLPVRELAGQIGRLIGNKDRFPIPDLVYEVMIGQSGVYQRALASGRGQDRMMLNRFYEIAREHEALYPNAVLGDFLEYLTYLSGFPVAVEEEQGTDAVRVMTVHQSKGKEFSAVFIVDMADKKFPLTFRRKEFVVPHELMKGIVPADDDRSLHEQEERRLFYVAMTRAEEYLCLCHASWYGANKQPKRPSKFLTDLSFDENPLIRVVDIPAEETVMAPAPASETGRARSAIQNQLIDAVIGMRLGTALQRLILLEKLKRLEENGDTESFDREAFLDVPEDDRPLDALLGVKPEPVTGAGLRVSASSLRTYEDCPLQYKFRYVLRVPSRPKPYFSRGLAVHQVIEELSREQISGRRATSGRAAAILDRIWQPLSFDSRTGEKEAMEKAAAALRNYLTWQESNVNTISGIEQRFSFPCEGCEVKGFVDRIETTPEGEMVVIDFKTGSSAGVSRNTVVRDIQMNLYCLAVREMSGCLPKRATLLFLQDGRQVDYFPTGETIAAFEERLKGIIGQIGAHVFEPTPGYQVCRYCDYAGICDENRDESPGQ